MKKNDELYGLKDQETLDADPDEVVQDVLENACAKAGESFDAIADRITWPLRVFVYRRRQVGDADRLAQRVLECMLEELDCEYADPGGDATVPTSAMRSASLALANAVVADYVSWACEPTGEVIEYTRERARRECGE